MNGDILTTLDYTKLIAYHREKGGILTIGTHSKLNKVNLGVIETDCVKVFWFRMRKNQKRYIA
jgi:NDP-sugar pyrophosphorylase family protein